MELALNCVFTDRSETQYFVREEVPFAVRGSYGGNTPCVEIGDGDEFIICDAET